MFGGFREVSTSLFGLRHTWFDVRRLTRGVQLCEVPRELVRFFGTWGIFCYFDLCRFRGLLYNIRNFRSY